MLFLQLKYSCGNQKEVLLLMAKLDKVRDKIYCQPTASNLTWNDIAFYLNYFGYRKMQAEGSRVRFIHGETNDVIRLHKPHPGNELKKYVVEQLQEKLEWTRN